MHPYLTDWRDRYTGSAIAVLRPASTAEVASVVALCARAGVAIVPQGGNTGLVLGSVPDTTGNSVVLSLKRMNSIRSTDLLNATMTVEAGCILEDLQNAAAASGRLFPLSLAAEGSCTIGGNLATNAGGTAVLRYGSMRDLCLGLEVVTADGQVWDGLRALRKENTGYDLRNLFIGAEGTLGIITAAVLKLFPQPKAQITALVALHTPDDALALLEISDSESEDHAIGMLEVLVSEAIEKELVVDAIVASSIAQSKALWNLREHITLAQAAEGKHIKHDVSVPISNIADFIRVTDALVQKLSPGCRMVTFGHLGDGNLHYNVSAPEGVADSEFIKQQEAINQVVHDSVHRFGGSISAEHGLGMLKRDEIRRYKSDVDIRLMSAIKKALDPSNILNPGKVL